MKKSRSCFIAPIFVMIILLFIYSVSGLYPFGNKTISWCDMNQQVIPFLMDFKDILEGKSDMFLNLQNAGGMSFWGVFLFFISSPFTFLVLFVEKADMYFFVNILVLLKMMICSLTASIYFKNEFKNLHVLQNVSLSVMYAFCGYTMFYYQNQVWLDIMYLFPILLLGLSRLIKENKVALYVITFSAVMTVNFYLSYMVSIFIVLSFGIYIFFFTPKEKRYKNILLLEISTLLVALITSVVWLPSLMQYLQSARTENVLTSLKIGGFFSRFDTTLAVIICSSAVFCALISYIMFKRNLHRTADFTFIIFMLTLIPVIIEPINKMWHTGNYQAFPVRYGYITIFFGLILFASVLSEINNKNNINSSNLILTFIAMIFISMVFLSACFILDMDYKTVTAYTRTLWGNSNSFKLLLLFSLTAFLAYFILLLFYRYKKISISVFSVLLFTVVVIEAAFNSNVYISSAAKSVNNELSVIDMNNRIEDNSLYRVKTDKKYFDVNLLGSLGYNTLNHYTSLTNQNFMFTMKKLGYSSYWMEVNSNGGTKLTDSILGNKYTIYRNNNTELDDNNTVYKNDIYTIKQNKMSLPMGFVFQTKNIDELKSIELKNRFDIQQKIFQTIFNTNEELFVKYYPNIIDNINCSTGSKTKMTFKDNRFSGNLIYSIPIKEKQTLYFDCFDKLTNNLVEPIYLSFSIYVNGELIQSEYPNQANNGILNLGTFKNETVNIEIRLLKEVNVNSFGIVGLKDKVLENSINKVKSLQLKQSNNKISGNVFMKDNSNYLFLPISYNKGFTVSINNKPCQIVNVCDSMMAVKLNKGLNDITISFMPCGFIAGAGLSFTGIFIALILTLFKKRKNLYYKIKFLEIPATVIFVMLFIIIFVLIYIFPIIIYFK